IYGLFRRAKRHPEAELSFEGHPNNTTKEHLETLSQLGFTRVSYGVQDYNETVQRAIHRVQPFENVKHVSDTSRELGFKSVGHDLIYGLPFQTKDHIVETIERTKEIMPDRIAFYSYAHVPWLKGNGQRGFKKENLPTPEEKGEQYRIGKELLLEAGYVEIGMDHFALPTDSLYEAIKDNTIHRNFMGYSASKTQVMIGLGVSAISDSWYSFAQNVKGVEEYQKLVEDGIFPVFRGHILTKEDLVVRKHILNLMCNFLTDWQDSEMQLPQMNDIIEGLSEMEMDGLIEINDKFIQVKEKGKPFVRNICMAFDLRLQRNKPETQLFSMTV
ncbi:MAG: radical SAM protein, partial [Flavobacteriaceae bacterium]|nr:radical SAM protein [Flavobacteriaceae bacterium]